MIMQYQNKSNAPQEDTQFNEQNQEVKQEEQDASQIKKEEEEEEHKMLIDSITMPNIGKLNNYIL